MSQYAPPVYGIEYIFYVGFVSQADTKLLQTNPTLAAGDVKVSKDGGALANLNTLPAVTPASGKLVKVTLSSTEMGADNVAVIFSDAAGDEWCDLSVDIQPTKLLLMGTVDTTVAPSTTEFEADDITEATADHFIGRVVIFTSGVLKDQATVITDYALNGGRGHFTVQTMTEAPGNNDTFVIV